MNNSWRISREEGNKKTKCSVGEEKTVLEKYGVREGKFNSYPVSPLLPSLLPYFSILFVQLPYLIILFKQKQISKREKHKKSGEIAAAVINSSASIKKAVVRKMTV